MPKESEKIPVEVKTRLVREYIELNITSHNTRIIYESHLKVFWRSVETTRYVSKLMYAL
jgi:hypothetical protein